MAAYDKIAVVTGSNKGIGFAIVRQLALQYPQSPANTGPFLIYLTARDQGRGQQALSDIHSDPALKSAKALKQDGGLSEVAFHELDISQTNSIRAFSEHLRKQHPGGIDMVINNAGVAMQGFDAGIVKQTLEANYFGTLEATQDFLPLIKQGGRLVNVASMAGHLSKYSDSIRQKFLQAKSHDEITALMQGFKKAVAAGKENKEGWPSAAYAVSKAGSIGMTRTIAMEAKSKGNNVLINSCCPGYVKTDMTRGGGAKAPDQGAQTPVMLALQDIGGKSGLFWQHEKPIEW